MSEATQITKQSLVYIDRDQYTTTIDTAGHQIIADEPESKGGKNKGPDPFSLLLSSLGSCVVITLRMYADRKEMNVDRIAADVTMNSDQNINVAIEIDGDITDKERKRLKQIADMCPVNKFLLKEASISKEMV